MTKLYNATIRAAIGLSVGLCLFCGIIFGQLYFDRQARIERHQAVGCVECVQWLK